MHVLETEITARYFASAFNLHLQNIEKIIRDM